MGPLLSLAARQGGVILRHQAEALGIDGSRLERRVKKGEWQRIAEGAYRIFPALDDRDHLRSAVAILPGAVVSHGSAALLLDLTDRPPRRPQVTVHASTTSRCPNVDVRRSRNLLAEHTEEQDGLPITTPARTLVDLAVDLLPDRWITVADAAIARRRVSSVQLAEVAAVVCGQGRRGSGTIREFLDDPLAGSSPLERKAIRLIVEARLPTPEREYPLPWDPRRRFDLAYPEYRVAIELDGRRWHDTREAFESDRRRDREAVRHGWVVLRFTWEDIVRRPHEFIREIAAVLGSRSVR